MPRRFYVPRLNPLPAVRGRDFRRPWYAAWLAAPLPAGREGAGGRARNDLGARGEELAYWFLRRQGYTIVARNLRQPGQRGELDLVGWEGGALAIIEVKTRSGRDEFAAERAVDWRKRLQLMRLGRRLARRARPAPARLRFDVVCVYLPPNATAEIELHRDAFSPGPRSI